MTDHIIKVAIEAAGYPQGTELPMQPDPQTLAWLSRFYAIAYRQGMEDAADEAIDIVARHGGSVEIEAAIRQRLHPDHFLDANEMVQPTEEQGATT